MKIADLVLTTLEETKFADEQTVASLKVNFSLQSDTSRHSVPVEIELSVYEAKLLGDELLRACENWYKDRREAIKSDILEKDELKSIVIDWLEENDWSDISAKEREWVSSRIVHFNDSPDLTGDHRIHIDGGTKLADLLSLAPKGHLVWDYFVIVIVEEG